MSRRKRRRSRRKLRKMSVFKSLSVQVLSLNGQNQILAHTNLSKDTKIT
jgi:hypothetical protein